jgi:hypothetical protein
MEKALFINGVYETVFAEIINAQKQDPEMVCYLQPYSSKLIKDLKNSPPNPENPLPLYLSTTNQLNHICYMADIVGWEDKRDLSEERLDLLNGHIREFQPGEGEIYFQMNGKNCVNLISIRNLKKMTNQLSVENLIKVSDGKPLKNRTRSGGWSYVYMLPFIGLNKTIVKEQMDKELENLISKSLKDNEEVLKQRLEEAPKLPEKVQTISSGFLRNPDVVAMVLKRANGKCELCKSDAPFIKASDGSPYLEVHHWVLLSEGGEDTIENAGALCPNCHMQAHFGKNKDYIQNNKTLPSDT